MQLQQKKSKQNGNEKENVKWRVKKQSENIKSNCATMALLTAAFFLHIFNVDTQSLNFNNIKAKMWCVCTALIPSTYLLVWHQVLCKYTMT